MPLSMLVATVVAAALILAPAAGATTTEYPNVEGGAQSLTGDAARAPALTVGAEGNIWFVGATGFPVGSPGLTGIAGHVGFGTPLVQFAPNVYQGRSWALNGVTRGPENNFWAVSAPTNTVIEMGADGNGVPIPLPSKPGAGSYPLTAPAKIATGSDGAFWLTAEGSSAIGRVERSGAITAFALTTGAAPHGIVAGPDGALWFTEKGAGAIGRITTAGSVSTFPLPNPAAQPNEITVGPDGNLWFTEAAGGKIGRITPQGQITEFAAENAGPIVSGPYGDLWFGSTAGIGSISTTGEYVPAVCVAYCAENVEALVVGPEGKLWFSSKPEAQEGGGNTYLITYQQPGRIGVFKVPAPTISLSGSRLQGRGSRWEQVGASCTGGAAAQPCKAVVRLSWSGRQIGSRQITLTSGTPREISIELGGFAPKAFGNKGSIKAQATFTSGGVTGKPVKVTLTRPPGMAKGR